MTRLVKLINQGDYREAIFEAYSGKYSDNDFGPSVRASGKPSDTIGGRTVMGPEYNVQRAVNSLARVDSKFAPWLLWCYTEHDNNNHAMALQGLALDALISHMKDIGFAEIKDWRAAGKGFKLLGGMMENHREQHRNGRQLYPLDHMAVSMGYKSPSSLCGNTPWGRVRASFERGLNLLDSDAINALMQTLEGYRVRVAA